MVADCDAREGGAIGLVSSGVVVGWSSGAITAAKIVGCEDAESFGVEGFAWSDKVIPPAIA